MGAGFPTPVLDVASRSGASPAIPTSVAQGIGERRSRSLRRGDVGNYIANLPANTDLRTLAATIKARWICEQAHQQLKDLDQKLCYTKSH
jgi:hypothetical protein